MSGFDIFLVVLVFGGIAVVIAAAVGLRRMMHDDDVEPGSSWGDEPEDDRPDAQPGN